MPKKKYTHLKLPIKVRNKLDRKHHSGKWTNVYWYVDKIRQKCDKVVYEKEVISGDCYKQNTLYKVSHMSKKGIWDYYRILKPEYAQPQIAMQADRIRKNNVSSPAYGYTVSKGSVIISFQ